MPTALWPMASGMPCWSWLPCPGWPPWYGGCGDECSGPLQKLENLFLSQKGEQFVARKLKPVLEARAKAKMSPAGSGDQKNADAKPGSATLPNPISSVDTSKELVTAVGLGPSRQGHTRPTNRCVWGDVRTRVWYRIPGRVPAETASDAPSMAARMM